jgi:hypothetical protein
MRGILIAICLTICSNTWGAIGSVTEAPGSPGEITRGKEKITGGKGAQVESNDVYATKNAGVGITFKDDTKVKITENSRLLIDDFVFDPNKSDAGKLAMKVTMGTVRYASGQIAKNNPQQVAVKTPTATIAVRGTDFTMTVDETGKSLIVLLPSCKDDEKKKEYELEENTCRVGKIEVTTEGGSVVLDRAFEATYVATGMGRPTPPVVLNTVETHINNLLILSRPAEIDKAIKQAARTKQDEYESDLMDEAQRMMLQKVKESADALERARLLAMAEASGKAGCNPTSSICVIWEKNDASDIQSKGKGVAYRVLDNEHYAEVKTQGYSSNTFISIVQNDSLATELIGSGDPGGNNVYIKQNSGIRRR